MISISDVTKLDFVIFSAQPGVIFSSGFGYNTPKTTIEFNENITGSAEPNSAGVMGAGFIAIKFNIPVSSCNGGGVDVVFAADCLSHFHSFVTDYRYGNYSCSLGA
jgi:hypothetical protein